jgi:hypothetical protein
MHQILVLNGIEWVFSSMARLIAESTGGNNIGLSDCTALAMSLKVFASTLKVPCLFQG